MAGITSVLLVMMLRAARVLLAMARDGLLPRPFAAIHPSSGRPGRARSPSGRCGLMAGFLPIGLLHLTNIGTLFAFAIVCAAVLIMRRRTRKPRPSGPFVPVARPGHPGCLLLMFSLPAANWLRLFAWLAIGLVIYFLYGRRHSVLRRWPPADLQESPCSPRRCDPSP